MHHSSGIWSPKKFFLRYGKRCMVACFPGLPSCSLNPLFTTVCGTRWIFLGEIREQHYGKDFPGHGIGLGGMARLLLICDGIQIVLLYSTYCAINQRTSIISRHQSTPPPSTLSKYSQYLLWLRELCSSSHVTTTVPVDFPRNLPQPLGHCNPTHEFDSTLHL
ncbi:hypothetical protein DM02DRAFT_308073 [Periconia macrospinosa]|uniref:Uncharacterized protein n=1 Tax=Periconia macrospinosa TaxID=97972 RepID=A0A2V1DYP2_9PLEO|nr:hypothetical protein DM02DRAFT_308073 [Periconia macrospinosa]